MAAATISNKTEILKRLYPSGTQGSLFKRSKAAMMCKKSTNFLGEGRYVVIDQNGTTGGSSDFSTAVQNEGTSTEKRFFVTRRREYQVFKIDGELMNAGKGEGAVIDAVKQQTDKALFKFGRAVAARFWGGAGGALAQISASATISSATILLRNAGEHARFEVGDRICGSTDTGTATSPAGLIDSGAAAQVVSIDRAANTVTFSAALNSLLPSVTVNTYLFREGDYANTMTGITGWNPLTAPSASENFFGVDRSVGDVQRQCGLIFPTTGSTYEAKLVNALAGAASCGIEGLDACFVNPVTWGLMAVEFGDAKRSTMTDKNYNISYSSLTLSGPDGDVKVYAEPDVPAGKFWIESMDNIELASAGAFPMEIKDKSGAFLRLLDDEDAYRGRLGGYANIIHNNPGQSVQGSF